MGIGQKIAQIVSGNSIYLNPPQWTDKSFPLTQVKLGILDKPDFDFTELGLLFPQNDTSEKIFILDQMWHQKKLDTPLRLHVHFVQTSALLPNFTCEYRYYNNGDVIPGWTTVNTDAGAGPVITYPGSGSIVNLVRFPDIVPPSPENISAILDMIIYRNDNRITGDVLTKYVDYHFQADSSGSRQEFQK